MCGKFGVNVRMTVLQLGFTQEALRQRYDHPGRNADHVRHEVLAASTADVAITTAEIVNKAYCI